MAISDYIDLKDVPAILNTGTSGLVFLIAFLAFIIAVKNDKDRFAPLMFLLFSAFIFISSSKIVCLIPFLDCGTDVCDGIQLPDKEIENTIKKYIPKNSLFNESRIITYTLKSLDKGNIVYDMENKSDVKNNSKDPIFELFEITLNKDNPQPQVFIDRISQPLTRETSTLPDEVIWKFKFTIEPGKSKEITKKIENKNAKLPYKDMDAVDKSTLVNEFCIQGKNEIIEKLNISVEGYSWHENIREEFPPSSGGNKIKCWKSTNDALLPSQGILFSIIENNRKSNSN